MATSSLPLTSLSEAQRAQAQERFRIIRPALDKEITQAEIAHTHQVSARTIQRWIKNYREKGLAGLADTKTRSDFQERCGSSLPVFDKLASRWLSNQSCLEAFLGRAGEAL